MAATPVTPTAGLASSVPTGGTAVVAAGPVQNGGFIMNPASADGQGLSVPESLFIDPVASCLAQQGPTTFEIAPGETWNLIAGQTTNTWVNCVSDGHKFSVVVF